MPDTPRTLVQLQAIFPDNVTAEISPQDLRDFVVSAALVTGTGELGGTADVPTVNAVHAGSAHHAAVTLGADADGILGLTGQQIDLDPQNANKVLAGPTTGADADPTFRALVDADIPAAIARDAEVSTAISTHEADTSGAHVAQGVSVADAGAHYTATDVEAALAEFFSHVLALKVASIEISDSSFKLYESGTVRVIQFDLATADNIVYNESNGGLDINLGLGMNTPGMKFTPDGSGRGLWQITAALQMDGLFRNESDDPSYVIAGGVLNGAAACEFSNAVDTEGAAASDDLDTISNWDGDIFFLRAANDARTVVLKDGTGNIHTGVGDISLDSTAKWVLIRQLGGEFYVIGGAAAATGGGHTIQESGSDLASEPRLNFKAGLVASDNAGVATDVDVDYAGTAELVNVTKAAEAAGTSPKVARGDHKHDIDTAAPNTVGTANAEGTATSLARSDHVHAHEAAHLAHDTLWDAAGDLVQGSGADAAAKLSIAIPAANVRNVLGVDNGETTWSVKAILDGTNPAAIGTAAPGTALTAAHRDHVHAHGAQTVGSAHRDEDIDVTGMKASFQIIGWQPTTTAGCGPQEKIEVGSTNKHDFLACPFDSASAESAFAYHELPDNYDGSTVTFRVWWLCKTGFVSTSSDGVAWTLKATAYADGDAIDTAYGTGITITDVGTANNQARKTADSAALTIGNTPAAGKMVHWVLTRTVSDAADDWAADAYPLIVTIEYGITALSQ